MPPRSSRPTRLGGGRSVGRGGTKAEPRPEVMTRWGAAPVLAPAVILDLLRTFFHLFWFFGPTLLAATCVGVVNNMVGASIADISGKLVALGCTFAGGAVGVAAVEVTTPFGIFMAEAIGLIAFLSLGLLILMINARLLKAATHAPLQFAAAFALCEVPFLGAIPVFTIIIWRLYGQQITVEKEALAKWKKENAARELAEHQQQMAELQQMQLMQAEQQTQTLEQEQTEDEGGDPQEEGVERAPHLQLKSPTEQWLRDRYEAPYRNEQARRIRAERVSLTERKGLDFGDRRRLSPDDYASRRAGLRKAAEGVNRSTRTNIRNTSAALDAGELDIRQLAIKNNAVVVHAVPLDDWSMKNTSANNQVVDTTTMSARDKIKLMLSQAPDLSASILTADAKIKNQEMFYPFGLIIDGKIIASYPKDVGTHAVGDSRRLKEEFLQSTLQENVAAQFGALAQGPARGDSYNESIVHLPNVRGVLIDEEVLRRAESYYPAGHAQGKPYNMERVISEVEKMDLGVPIYFRRADGIYDRYGRKVSAEDIYTDHAFFNAPTATSPGDSAKNEIPTQEQRAA